MAEWAVSHDVRLSAGRTGSCHDNAVAESFFATLKNEMYSLRPWDTRGAARHAVVEFIEAYYNRQRPHSTIGYEIPAERMDAFMERMETVLAGGEEGELDVVLGVHADLQSGPDGPTFRPHPLTLCISIMRACQRDCSMARKCS